MGRRKTNRIIVKQYQVWREKQQLTVTLVYQTSFCSGITCSWDVYFKKSRELERGLNNLEPLLLFVVFWDKFSVYGPGYPGIYSIDQAGL